MRRVTVSIILVVLVMGLLTLSVWASPVPDALPTDMDADQVYWYMIELNDTYLKKGVFTDVSAYTDEDRENARRAATLIIEAVTKEVEENGTANQHMIWLRGCAYEALFIDTNDPSFRLKALDDYKEAIDRGSVFAEDDYKRVEAMETSTTSLDWQIPQMLTLNEASSLLNEEPLLFVAPPSLDDDPNELGVGYALMETSDPAASTIYVFIDLDGGFGRYDALKQSAFVHEPVDVGGLADAAFLVGLRNEFNNPLLFCSVVALYGNTVIQVRVPDRAWRRLDVGLAAEEVAIAFADKLLDNLLNTERELPTLDGIVMENLDPFLELPAPEENASFSDEWPDDLGYFTPRGYVMELYNNYLPVEVFTNGTYNQLARDNARQAMRIIVRWINADVAFNGPDQQSLELRAYCYYLAYLDTDDITFWHLALNDYKHLLSTGYTYVRADYRLLAHPILSKMEREIERGNEIYVTRLQDWLNDAGFLAEPFSDEATTAALKAFEEAVSLERDGIADFEVLLELYARVDDDDGLIYDD